MGGNTLRRCNRPVSLEEQPRMVLAPMFGGNLVSSAMPRVLPAGYRSVMRHAKALR